MRLSTSASESISSGKTRTRSLLAWAARTSRRANLVPTARTVPHSTTGPPAMSARAASSTRLSPTSTSPSCQTA
nr:MULTISPECIES: hypothetical protein [unclassified Frankia]